MVRTGLRIACLLSFACTIGIPPVSVSLGQETGVPARDRLDVLSSLMAEGNYIEAENRARAMLNDVEAEAGPHSPAAADILDVLVEALWRGGKATDDETLELAERTLRIREEQYGPAHPAVANRLVEKANVLQSRGDLSQAEAPLLRAMEIFRDSGNPEGYGVALVHSNLGSLYMRLSRQEDARRHLERAVTLYETLSGPESLDVADVLANLSSLLFGLGDWEEAERLNRLAHDITVRELGPGHPQVGTILGNLAYSKWEMGDLEEARPLMEESMSILEAALGPDHPHMGDSWLNYGLLLLFMGEVDRAEEAYLKAISIYEGCSHPHLAGGLYNYAVLLQDRGDLVSARRLRERALDILLNTEGPQSPRFAWTLASLAGLDRRLGEYDQARTRLESALAVLEESYGPDHHGLSDTLGELANLELEAGYSPAAERHARRGLALSERAHGSDHHSVVHGLQILGKVLQESGDWAGARSAFERALEIEKRISTDADNETLRSSELLLAEYHAETGDCHETLEIYRRALPFQMKTRGPDDPRVGESRRKMATCLVRIGRQDEAFVHALEADRVARHHLRLVLTGLSERIGLQYSATQRTGLDLLLSILAPASASLPVRQGYDSLIRSRALVQDELAGRRKEWSSELDAEAANLAGKLAEARHRLAFLTVRGPADPGRLQQHRRLLEKARSDRDQAERELAEKNRGFRLRRDRQQAGFKEVSASLPQGSGIIGFARYDRLVPEKGDAGETASLGISPSYLAFVLTSEMSDPVLVPLGSVDEIDELVSGVQDQFLLAAEAPEWSDRQAESSYRYIATMLRKRIWDPVSPHLAGIDILFVVPDGDLHLVNFAALPVERNRYLIETFSFIHYLSAERELVSTPPKGNGRSLLALGNPDYDEQGFFASLVSPGKRLLSRNLDERIQGKEVFRGSRPACRDLQAMKFMALPATEKEVAEVIEQWRSGRKTVEPSGAGQSTMDVTLLQDDEASETAFKLMAPGHSALHLATHGFFLGGDCPSRLPGGNPLLLSGLALAGANHRDAAGPDEDDGILTAEEVTSLDLASVEWVVLSACNTGVGEIRAGEGILGLRRAFHVAGARTLITSLWPVEDEVGREWMRSLYDSHFVKGLGTARAVRAASLAMLRGRRAVGKSTHPFYWAGFVASGDWR